MRTQQPKRRVGLVTFSEAVNVIGDGTAAPKTLSGSALSDYAQLVTAGTGCTMDKPVGESAAALIDQVMQLREGGQTALGPAVITSVAMAARHPGSRVVVCTDGLANIGLGSLENDEERSLAEAAAAEAVAENENEESTSAEEPADGEDPADGEPAEDPKKEKGKGDKEETTAEVLTAAEQFYRRVGEYAASKGVAIDVIGIQGDCDLENLSVMADQTGGSVDKVDPTTIATNFSAMLANSIIATNVSATMLSHHLVHFRVRIPPFDPCFKTCNVRWFDAGHSR